MIGRIIGSIRRNHALEHATIAVLANKLGHDVRLVGRATRNGFYLYGDMPTEGVRGATTEAGPPIAERLLDWVGGVNVFYVCPGAYG